VNLFLIQPLDENRKPMNYYVTHATDLFQDPNLKWSLNVWQYDVGSQGNKRIGLFVWDEPAHRGHLSVLSQDRVEDLMLFNCRFSRQ